MLIWLNNQWLDFLSQKLGAQIPREGRPERGKIVHEELVCSISHQAHFNLIRYLGIPKTTTKSAHFHWRFHSSNLESCSSPLDEASTSGMIVKRIITR